VTASFISYCFILFAAAFACGLIAWLKFWSDDWLHLFISFGAGIFLGAVFFELLPEAMSHSENALAGVAMLLGYLMIFFTEKFVFSRGEKSEVRSHRVIALAAYFGLSVHSLVDGLGLAVASRNPEIGRVVFVSILAHHVPAAFSVSSLLSLGRMKRVTSAILLALFAAMPSIGALLFEPVLGTSSDKTFAFLLGMMTGTFLYVATGDLLPEVFHGKARQWRNLGLLLVGIGVMATISYGFAHIHER
jgi:zinc and cadmium transporter